MALTPVAVFAFNRPQALKRTLEALAACPGAAETDLYLFVDGPRHEKDAPKVAETRAVGTAITGFRSFTPVFSERNKGLAASIIGGVTDVLAQHDAVIVLEDDLRVMPGFLAFMNAGLEKYRDCPEVFSVCGYSNRFTPPKGYPYNTYFCARSSSWGWATWRDRWEKVDWEPSMESICREHFGFNRWGGSDCTRMLKAWRTGKLSSWAIRFCFSQYLAGAVSLFPVKSLVDNSAGFDGEGTNCRKFTRFKFELDGREAPVFRFPETTVPDRRIVRRALWYHSLPLRFYSLIRYQFER